MKLKDHSIHLFGNHDLRTINSRKTLEEIMGYENATFSFDLNGYHFVMLSTDTNENVDIDKEEINKLLKTVDGSTEKEVKSLFKTQYVSDREIEWLKNDLNNNKLPCIIFSHFGIAEDNQEGNYWFSKAPELGLLSNRKQIKDIINEDENVIGVFTAHQHWTKKITEDGKDYYILGSLTENINNDGVPDGVYFEVNLEEKNVEVLEKHIKI